MNPKETGGNGARAQLLAAYLGGKGGEHSEGMHLDAFALVLPEMHVHAYCFLQTPGARGRGYQQEGVSAGGCVRRGCLT